MFVNFGHCLNCIRWVLVGFSVLGRFVAWGGFGFRDLVFCISVCCVPILTLVFLFCLLPGQVEIW